MNNTPQPSRCDHCGHDHDMVDGKASEDDRVHCLSVLLDEMRGDSMRQILDCLSVLTGFAEARATPACNVNEWTKTARKILDEMRGEAFPNAQEQNA